MSLSQHVHPTRMRQAVSRWARSDWGDCIAGARRECLAQMFSRHVPGVREVQRCRSGSRKPFSLMPQVCSSCAGMSSAGLTSTASSSCTLKWMRGERMWSHDIANAQSLPAISLQWSRGSSRTRTWDSKLSVVPHKLLFRSDLRNPESFRPVNCECLHVSFWYDLAMIYPVLRYVVNIWAELPE